MLKFSAISAFKSLPDPLVALFWPPGHLLQRQFFQAVSKWSSEAPTPPYLTQQGKWVSEPTLTFCLHSSDSV